MHLSPPRPLLPQSQPPPLSLVNPSPRRQFVPGLLATPASLLPRRLMPPARKVNTKKQVRFWWGTLGVRAHQSRRRLRRYLQKKSHPSDRRSIPTTVHDLDLLGRADLV